MKLRFAAVLMVILLAPAVSLAAPAGSPFGINGCSWSHLGANTGEFDREKGLRRLAELKAAGATWDRCDFWWTRLEPEPGTFEWQDYDWVVAQYREAGIELMPILCYFSAWSDGKAPTTDEERERFGRYVFEVVSRYKNDIKVWEIWNEPNIRPFWEPTPRAEDYARLLEVAYAAAKKADPDCTIVGGVIAGIDYPFIEALLKAGAGKHMDVFSFHPYQGDLGSISPDAGDLAGQIRTHRQLLDRHECDAPLWLTEIGHRTPGTAGHTFVSTDAQAAYLVRTYVIALGEGVEKVFWFNLQDWEEYWGLIDQQFERKPSHRAYRTMADHLTGRRCLGQVDAGEGLTAWAFGADADGDDEAGRVIVVWSPDDQPRSPSLTVRRGVWADGRAWEPGNATKVGALPLFVTEVAGKWPGPRGSR